MSELNTIMLATDFSEGSLQAADMALSLMKMSGATLKVVNIATTLSSTLGAEGALYSSAVDMEQINDEIVSDARKRLEEFTNEHLRGPAAEAAGRIDTEVIQAPLPYEAITEAAERLQADLIVLGTHGRSGLRRVLLGSTAEHVLRTATVPVLTTRDHTNSAA